MTITTAVLLILALLCIFPILRIHRQRREHDRELFSTARKQVFPITKGD